MVVAAGTDSNSMEYTLYAQVMVIVWVIALIRHTVHLSLAKAAHSGTKYNRKRYRIPFVTINGTLEIRMCCRPPLGRPILGILQGPYHAHKFSNSGKEFHQIETITVVPDHYLFEQQPYTRSP